MTLDNVSKPRSVGFNPNNSFVSVAKKSLFVVSTLLT